MSATFARLGPSAPGRRPECERAARRPEPGREIRRDRRERAEDADHDERHDADPCRGQGRSGQRAAEERDRGEDHEGQPLEHGRGRDPGDGECLEQDERVEPGGGRDANVATASVPAIATSFATRNAPRPAGLVRMSAAVPRSFSVATEPIARRPRRAPRTGRGSCSWSTASAAVGGGRTIWNWSPSDRLQDLRREPGQQGRARARSAGRSTAIDRQPERPPLLEELLAEEGRGPPSVARSARPDEAAPVELVRRSAGRRARGRRPRASGGRVRTPPGGPRRRHDERQDLARGRGGVRTVTRAVAVGGRRRPGTTAHAAAAPRARRPRPPGRARASAGRSAGHARRAARSSAPSVTSRPRSRIATRSQTRSTSARTWVETDDGRLAAQPRDQLEDVAPALRVERAHRLVEEHDRRPVEEGLGDPEPLAHPARVAADPAVRGRRSARSARASRRPARAARHPQARRAGPTSSSSSRPRIQP